MAGDSSRPTHRSLNWVWDVGLLTWVVEVQPATSGGGGGGAATIADGADVAQGATTDAAVSTDTTGTISAKLRGLVKIFADVWDSTNHWLTVRQAVTTAAPLNGQAKIAVTGTAVQLGTNTVKNGVILTAKSNNTASIEVGGATVTNTVDGTGNGYILEAGGSVSFAVDNTNRLYINGTANDIVSFAGS